MEAPTSQGLNSVLAFLILITSIYAAGGRVSLSSPPESDKAWKGPSHAPGNSWRLIARAWLLPRLEAKNGSSYEAIFLEGI